MEELLNQLITVGVCAGIMALCYLVWLSSGVTNVSYSETRTWNWKIFWEDLLKLLLHGVSMVLYVVAANLLNWLMWRLGGDISALVDAISVGLIVKLMVTASVDYMSKASENYKKFFEERHAGVELVDIDEDNVDYAGIAQDTKEAVSAITNSIFSIQEDPDAIAGEVITKKEAKQLAELGALPYYKVDVSTPQKAYQNLIGKGFDEGWGWQCVAGFKEFMFSLCGRYVAAGGAASGYAYEPACSNVCKLGFTWHEGAQGLQDGDWGIWVSGAYGHVAMYYRGKWLGQNQGAADGGIGNAFNLMSLPMDGFAGYFRPNIYSKATMKPDTGAETPTIKPNVAELKKGDKVTVLSYVDVNGTRLLKLQSTPYTVYQVNNSNRTAVLKSDDGDIYARMSFDNIKKVN